MGLDVTYKGSQIAQLTEDGNLTLETAGKYCEGDIELAYSGGGSDPNPVADDNDVIFIDYDGEIRYSYSAAEFAQLSVLPPNPVHEGLTAEGWNWDLADAKNYVSSYGEIVIGQLYHPSDGSALVIYADIQSALKNLYLSFRLNGSATINWGDGSSEQVSASNSTVYVPHNYTDGGEYIIHVFLANGASAIIEGDGSWSRLLGNGTSTGLACIPYGLCISRIELGANMCIGHSAFKELSLDYLILPDNCVHNSNNRSAPCRCKALIGPKTTSFWEHGSNLGINNNIGCLYYSSGKGKGPRGSNGTYNILRFTDSSAVNYGSYYSENAQCLKRTHLNEGITATGTNAFRYCFKLQKIKLPSTLQTINSNAFKQCYSLSVIEIPAAVTTIESNAFDSCYGLREIHFKSATPPTVAASNAFNNLPESCTIYVPSGKLSSYTSASNYPSSATYTYVEE